MSRLPAWIRRPLQTDQHFAAVRQAVRGQMLHTVCESARCPNRHECWNQGTATLMILGDICTRDCKFCAIKAGRPMTLDLDEPRRAAEAAEAMALRHVVLTSVARDDLADGGAAVFAETIRAIRERLPESAIEVLTPDFGGRLEDLDTVLDAGPDVFNHNIETVRRLQPIIRPQAAYGRSLSVLRHAASRSIVTKSGIMLGVGEVDEEVRETLHDLVDYGCSLLTVGQYLCPSREHHPVDRYVPPEKFAEWAETAKQIGFKGVAAGPMVRSSYKADELLVQARTP